MQFYLGGRSPSRDGSRWKHRRVDQDRHWARSCYKTVTCSTRLISLPEFRSRVLILEDARSRHEKPGSSPLRAFALCSDTQETRLTCSMHFGHKRHAMRNPQESLALRNHFTQCSKICTSSREGWQPTKDA